MKLLSQAVKFDLDLLHKYNKPIPRYTSYPPATELTEHFDPVHFQAAIAIGNHKQTPLSLYCHIPFCESPCYFCGCNTIITRRKEVADPYLQSLTRNIEQVAALVDSKRRVQQFHSGGGTPNYLSPPQMEILWTAITHHFEFEPDAEISIEVNPSYLNAAYVKFLKDLGFNRISFGIQDFHPQVQQAVNRIQPESLLFEVMQWIRSCGYESVNVDLIYGLPYQTLETFRTTIQKTIELDPDRIAIFNFAYVPWMKPVQRRLPQEALPSPAEKLAILQMVIEELTSHGYVYIGMDHFAKPDDELALAQEQGQLHRNFQGYTTKPESDLLGFGITSISMLEDVYTQNHKSLKDFYRAVDADQLPLAKGVILQKHDQIRRAVIMELMCESQVSKVEIEEKYHLSFDMDFNDYFQPEIDDLRALEADGLVRIWPDHIEVTEVGRLLIRNVASVFDLYLRGQQQHQFSRSV